MPTTSDHDPIEAALQRASGGLELTTVRGLSEMTDALSHCDDRKSYEAALTATLPHARDWVLPGVCQVCSAAVAFKGDWMYSDGAVPNWRERLICPTCELNSRQRFTAYLVAQVLGQARGTAVVYLYEQVTAFYTWASSRLAHTVIGSEYLGHGVAGGTIIDGVRHEDAMRLSFETGSLDMIVSTDVYEHVPDIEASLTEAARVLQPGGTLVFSIPFYQDRQQTTRRAAVSDGEVVHLLEPQYHGNPVSPDGSLVFFDYGWDILASCREAGLRDARAIVYWSSTYGYLGGGAQMVFVADR